MAIAFVASVSAVSVNDNTAVTAGIDTTGANLLVAVIATNDGGTPTLTDSKSNSWTALTARTGSATYATDVQLFYSVPTSVGTAHTFTATATGFYPAVAVIAFSGAHATPYTSQQSGAGLSVGATSIQPGSLTPSEDNCVLVTGTGPSGNGSSFGTTGAINSSFTLRERRSATANAWAIGIADKIQTTAGAENPTWSWTGADSNAAAMAVFKAAAVGGATYPGYYGSGGWC